MGVLKDGRMSWVEMDQPSKVCSSEAGIDGLAWWEEILEGTPCHMWKYRRKMSYQEGAHLMEMERP
jgi:hypothetical protein